MEQRKPLAFCLGFLAAFAIPRGIPPSGPTKTPLSVQRSHVDLPANLERCAAYCDRLEGAILDFVCTEKIVETIREFAPAKTASAGRSGSGATYYSGRTVMAGAATRFTYLYDYQLVRDRSGVVTETRTLLEEGGRRVEEKHAPLKTHAFHYAYVVMGPVGLLGREAQKRFDFEVVKEGTLRRDRVIIVKAAPKPGSDGDILYGMIWIRTSDSAILRIEWEPESMGNYDRIEEKAWEFGATPKLSFATEYAFEKNGVRFPSRYSIEEAYSRKMRPPLVQSTTEVTFGEYRFFTVETGVVIRS